MRDPPLLLGPSNLEPQSSTLGECGWIFADEGGILQMWAARCREGLPGLGYLSVWEPSVNSGQGPPSPFHGNR